MSSLIRFEGENALFLKSLSNCNLTCKRRQSRSRGSAYSSLAQPNQRNTSFFLFLKYSLHLRNLFRTIVSYFVKVDFLSLPCCICGMKRALLRTVCFRHCRQPFLSVHDSYHTWSAALALSCDSFESSGNWWFL